MKRKIFLVLLLAASIVANGQQSPVVKSPDGKIVFTLIAREQKLVYTITADNTTVIEPSELGILVNGRKFGDSCTPVIIRWFKVNEVYDYRGIHSKASNNYNGAEIRLQGRSSFSMEVRVFNNGVAFRYKLNEGAETVKVEDDNTHFVLSKGSMVWSQPNIKYYEGKYRNSLADTIQRGTLMGPPVTIELPEQKGFIAITEGGLTDFAGMSLKTAGERDLKAVLEGVPVIPGNASSPWRIIEIGKDLNTLVNCDIIANVSPALDKKLFPNGYHTKWVRPGRGVWSWLADRGPVTLENMKRFSDLAAQLGFEYNLVDEGWGYWKDSVQGKDSWKMMKELVDYSTAKGVKVWVWKAYPDRRGIAGLKDKQQRIAFFSKCRELGIAGLKIDFFDSERQEIIRFYQDALADAAKYQLMIDFHGANKPTGETRTWPNEMTREAIRGLENGGTFANHNTILPFTRLLAGHADYTPVHFGGKLAGSSWAHQVATMIIFTSPFMCLGADPQSIIDNPCRSMIQSIPCEWDETIVLPQSRIGDVVLFARRKGKEWFIAAINGSKEPKNIEVDLTFIKGNYKLTAVKDDLAKQDAVNLDESTVKSAEKLQIKLNGYGGYAARLR